VWHWLVAGADCSNCACLPAVRLTVLASCRLPFHPTCSGRVDLRQVEVTIQNLISSGMDPKTENNPYLGFIYTSFQASQPACLLVSWLWGGTTPCGWWQGVGGLGVR